MVIIVESKKKILKKKKQLFVISTGPKCAKYNLQNAKKRMENKINTTG